MANLNKVMLIGRLTRDPETRTFQTGGKVANFGFAVNNKKKNTQTGEWEDEPVFIDVKAFNRGEKGRQLADLVEQYLRKGKQFYLEGHLQLDQWTSQDGQKQSKLRLVLDDFQFLEPRQDGVPSEGGGSYQQQPRRTAVPASRPAAAAAPAMEPSYDEPEPQHGGGQQEEIPF